MTSRGVDNNESSSAMMTTAISFDDLKKLDEKPIFSNIDEWESMANLVSEEDESMATTTTTDDVLSMDLSPDRVSSLGKRQEDDEMDHDTIMTTTIEPTHSFAMVEDTNDQQQYQQQSINNRQIDNNNDNIYNNVLQQWKYDHHHHHQITQKESPPQPPSKSDDNNKDDNTNNNNTNEADMELLFPSGFHTTLPEFQLLSEGVDELPPSLQQQQLNGTLYKQLLDRNINGKRGKNKNKNIIFDCLTTCLEESSFNLVDSMKKSQETQHRFMTANVMSEHNEEGEQQEGQSNNKETGGHSNSNNNNSFVLNSIAQESRKQLLSCLDNFNNDNVLSYLMYGELVSMNKNGKITPIVNKPRAIKPKTPKQSSPKQPKTSSKTPPKATKQQQQKKPTPKQPKLLPKATKQSKQQQQPKKLLPQPTTKSTIVAQQQQVNNRKIPLPLKVQQQQQQQQQLQLTVQQQKKPIMPQPQKQQTVIVRGVSGIGGNNNNNNIINNNSINKTTANVMTVNSNTNKKPKHR